MQRRPSGRLRRVRVRRRLEQSQHFLVVEVDRGKVQRGVLPAVGEVDIRPLVDQELDQGHVVGGPEREHEQCPAGPTRSCAKPSNREERL